MNTLFNTDLKEEILPMKIHSSQTVQIQPTYYELVEDNVSLNLCIVDTPGFGDELNREHNLTPIIEYIDQQNEEYMTAERHPGFRKAIPDTRIHAVLYFVAPNGHGLKELDANALKTLSRKVNVIPLIAKADTMTAEERISFKKILLRDLDEHQIRTFPSSYPDSVDGAEELFKHIPFSVIGSDNFAVIGNRKVRCRSYRWGVVEVENVEHSDFIYLRELLLATCLHDLVESTHEIHYYQHRANALRSVGRPASILECDDHYETEIEGTKQTNKQEMERKEEEVRQKFIEKVQEKEKALREREEKLLAKKAEMRAELDQYRALVDAEQREVDELLASSQNNTLRKTPSKMFKST
ncbi:hypothetical protein BGX28_007273 [Mortierella sp. GBA30]|nr:hypothetical protein BGX28_007273 [Mortierella sp. GBA30]